MHGNSLILINVFTGRGVSWGWGLRGRHISEKRQREPRVPGAPSLGKGSRSCLYSAHHGEKLAKFTFPQEKSVVSTNQINLTDRRTFLAFRF